jgi:formamidase
MQDMVVGTVPWQDQVKIIDGASCGFAAPMRGKAAAE